MTRMNVQCTHWTLYPWPPLNILLRKNVLNLSIPSTKIILKNFFQQCCVENQLRYWWRCFQHALGTFWLFSFSLDCRLFRRMEGFAQFRKGTLTSGILVRTKASIKILSLIINVQDNGLICISSYRNQVPAWTLIGPGTRFFQGLQTRQMKLLCNLYSKRRSSKSLALWYNLKLGCSILIET